MTVTEQLETAIKTLEELRADAEKVDKGMAGDSTTRLRKWPQRSGARGPAINANCCVRAPLTP